MIDKPTYPLNSIYFYPTESCNLRCIHCWLHPPYAPNEKRYRVQNTDNITIREMETTIQDALPLGLSHIKLTGGEPFLHPDIFGYLDCFSKYNLAISIETNATRLDENKIKQLKKYNIRQISVSLDGSGPEIHDKIRGVKGSFIQALEGIRLLIDHQFNPQVIFCLQKLNANDLETTIQLTHSIKVKSFEINPLTHIGKTELKPNNCEGLDIKELILLEKKIEIEYAQKYPDMHVNLYLPPALKGIKELSRRSLCACKIFNICGILSNGDISICGIGIIEKDLVMGNIRKDNITHIWEEGKYFNIIRETVPGQLSGICGKCLFKHHCLGFCRADVLSESQTALGPNRLCQEAFENGLFPESRILDSANIDGLVKSPN